MFAATIKAAVLTAMLAMGATNAHAEMITFDNTVSAAAGGLGFSTYYANGYVFNANPGKVEYLTDAAHGGDTASSRETYNGTDYMSITYAVTMTNIASTPFSVASIDLGNKDYAYSSTARLTGTHVDGTTVTQSFTSFNDNRSSAADFTTVALMDFTNLTSFKIEQPAPLFMLSIDNINVSAVPEPSTWAMLGLGLAFVAASVRRKKAA